MSKLEVVEQNFSDWVVENPFKVVLLSCVWVALAAFGTSKLFFDSSYRVMFSEENPQLVALENIEQTYSENHNVIIVLAPSDKNVFTRETLKAVETLTEKSWQIPYSRRVDSISNFQYTTAQGDDLIVRDMVQNASLYTNKQLDDVKRAVLAEPALANRLISDSGDVTGININISMPEQEKAEATPLIAAFVRNIAEELEHEYPHIKTYLSGVVMLDNSFFESSMRDFSQLVPVSFGLMMLIIAILAGGLVGTIITMIVIIASVVGAMGMSGYIGFPLTGMSTSAPIIILTVAIANCVHVLVTFTQEMGKGMTKENAMKESLRINLQPVFLASITTAIGFTSLNFSEVPPFAHLGNIVSMGVVFAFVLTVTFLPAIIAILPSKILRKESSTKQDTWMSTLGDAVIHRRRLLLWLLPVTMIVLISNIPRNEFNDVFVHYFDTSIPFRADSDFMVENLTGVYINDYSLESGEPGGISNPQFLKEVEELALWIETLPESVHVDRFTTTMKRLNKSMHGDDDAYYALPQERELAAQYLLLYEMSLPYGLDINNQINVDKSATRLTHTFGNISSKQTVAQEEQILDWIEENASSIKTVTSGSIVQTFSRIGLRNSKAMILGTLLALAAISIILIIALRSLKLGLISLIPNLTPAAVGFGLWGIFVGEVGLTLSVVTGMSFGIVVDNTVHFLSKYLRAKRENGLPVEDAIRYAFQTVGKALLVTTSTLVVGFLTLATSSFKLNSDMGLLTAGVIAIALVNVFLLLPPLLMKIEGPTAKVEV